jgi:FlaA1/EpsC-like NDP-sugar epimerase
VRILVTGAKGAVGTALVPELEAADHRVFPTDIDNMDVTSSGDVWNVVAQTSPGVIVHLAASKLAVEGELHPVGFVNTNIQGTFNIIDAAKARGARLVFASTCKAADPETVYGACKLIAERAVLSAGGTVVRFYNILECGPSVKTIWEQIPAPDPIPYTACQRYFNTVEAAVGLLMASLDLPAGRYATDPGKPRHMLDVANELYPTRQLMQIPRRRGDRAVEPLHAACEEGSRLDGGLIFQIRGAHDPEPVEILVAA